MAPHSVITVRTNLTDAGKLVAETCRHFGYTPWSMSGNLAQQTIPVRATAARISIMDCGVDQLAEIGWEESIGSAYLRAVAPQHSQIIMWEEDLAGQPLAPAKAPKLKAFAERLKQLVQARGLMMSCDGAEASVPGANPSQT